jgi:hypothetical protein
MHDARIEGMRINVVIEDELQDPPLPASVVPEQERTALTLPVNGAPLQLANAGLPYSCVA